MGAQRRVPIETDGHSQCPGGWGGATRSRVETESGSVAEDTRARLGNDLVWEASVIAGGGGYVGWLGMSTCGHAHGGNARS